MVIVVIVDFVVIEGNLLMAAKSFGCRCGTQRCDGLAIIGSHHEYVHLAVAHCRDVKYHVLLVGINHVHVVRSFAVGKACDRHDVTVALHKLVGTVSFIVQVDSIHHLTLVGLDNGIEIGRVGVSACEICPIIDGGQQGGFFPAKVNRTAHAINDGEVATVVLIDNLDIHVTYDAYSIRVLDFVVIIVFVYS